MTRIHTATSLKLSRLPLIPQSDEIPDRGGTFEGFHSVDEDGANVIGLREMPNKALHDF